ncbi:hypothetical protein ACIQYS_12720 [Psychrobacillus sp. NPDC096426]
MVEIIIIRHEVNQKVMWRIGRSSAASQTHTAQQMYKQPVKR